MTKALTNPNAAVIIRFFDEVWNQGKESSIDELYAPDGFAEGLGERHREGPEQFKLFHQLFVGTCKDINLDLKNIMVDGDWVAFRAVVTATHKATGTKISFEGGGFSRISNGKIAEAYNAWNFMDLLIQLGVTPADILPKALLETK